MDMMTSPLISTIVSNVEDNSCKTANTNFTFGGAYQVEGNKC